MKSYILKDYYYKKEEFIRDFIEFCRECKNEWKQRGRAMPSIIYKDTSVNYENWSFTVIVDKNGALNTEAVLCKSGTKTEYPRTKWGGDKKRWDVELREFLHREINKEDKEDETVS